MKGLIIVELIPCQRGILAPFPAPSFWVPAVCAEPGAGHQAVEAPEPGWGSGMEEHIHALAWRALSWWEERTVELQPWGLGQGSHLPCGAQQGWAGDLLRGCSTTAACEAKCSCQSWLRGPRTCTQVLCWSMGIPT